MYAMFEQAEDDTNVFCMSLKLTFYRSFFFFPSLFEHYTSITMYVRSLDEVSYPQTSQ